MRHHGRFSALCLQQFGPLARVLMTRQGCKNASALVSLRHAYIHQRVMVFNRRRTHAAKQEPSCSAASAAFVAGLGMSSFHGCRFWLGHSPRCV